MKFTLSQILKYSGIVVGALGALKIVFVEFEVIQVHWICMIVIGLGALIYFIGVWEKKHENAIAKASTPITTSSATVTITPTTT